MMCTEHPGYKVVGVFTEESCSGVGSGVGSGSGSDSGGDTGGVVIG